MITTAIASITTAAPRKTLIEIVDRRVTCQGIQYTVADCLGSHTITINNGYIGCTCGLDRSFIECSHIRLVEAQELVYAEEASRRAAYIELFGIYS
jgi:hypothetical protein